MRFRAVARAPTSRARGFAFVVAVAARVDVRPSSIATAHRDDARRRPTMPVSRVTVFHEGSCARARKALAALRDEGVQESEFHKINLDALTPDARATRLEGLRALAGHGYTPAVFFNAEYVGSEVEITHLARTGALARELLRDGDCEIDALPRALRDVEDDERDDPGSGRSIYGRSKSIKLETREGEESEGKKAKKKTRTRAATYARMTETMKHAMRYRRAEATMMAASSSSG